MRRQLCCATRIFSKVMDSEQQGNGNIFEQVQQLHALLSQEAQEKMANAKIIEQKALENGSAAENVQANGELQRALNGDSSVGDLQPPLQHITEVERETAVNLEPPSEDQAAA